MRRSDAFLPTSRESRAAGTDATDLAYRAGLVRDFGSGLFGFAPAGERVRRRLVERIEAEIERIGGQPVAAPQLQYDADWRASGRWESFEDEMFTLANREGRELCLAPSHEEAIVRLVDGAVRSYDDLPALLYQTGAKHRDDHARNGLVRTKEFTMHDAYSLHVDEASLRRTYERVRSAYLRVFADLGLGVAVVGTGTGVMGGSASEEFVAPVERGSCELVACTADGCRFGVTDEHEGFAAHGDGDRCPECGGRLAASEGIEVAHVFRLGTRYSEAMDLTVDDRDGAERLVRMGSYGIGVTRLLATILAQRADDRGCRWPVTERGPVAPYGVAIVPVAYEGELREAADRLHGALDDALLFDDPDRSVGERFAESDLLGIPLKVVLGDHYRETGEVELEGRDGETRYVDESGVHEAIETFHARDGDLAAVDAGAANGD